MQGRRYALVAYIRNAAGEFVENLRRELHPTSPHLPAHLTLLPPRPLQGTESGALRLLERVCGQAEPFEIQLGGVETFCPMTPTVYIEVKGASRMCELHEQLNREALLFNEEWPYIPHLTIAKMAGEESARDAFSIAAERWESYSGTRRILLERLTFVREDSQDNWVDLAPVQLGQRLVSR